VLMPEASVHEDDFSVAAKHKVGLAGKIAATKAIATTQAVNQTAYCELRACVRPAYARHDAAAMVGGNVVHDRTL
jgi:hypothetical protein